MLLLFTYNISELWGVSKHKLYFQTVEKNILMLPVRQEQKESGSLHICKGDRQIIPYKKIVASRTFWEKSEIVKAYEHFYQFCFQNQF